MSDSTGRARGEGTAPQPPGHPALTDELTGLPNRLHFETVYRVVFEAADRGVPISLLAVGLDGWEPEGHRDGGDVLQREVAERLRRGTRGSDLVARVDEGLYQVLLMVCNAAGARVAADRLQDALAGVGTGEGATVSIGVATTHGEMKEGEELLASARRALDHARVAGGGGVEVFVGARP